MSQNKDSLYQELLFKARVNATGINVKPYIFKHLALGSEYMELYNVSPSDTTIIHDVFQIEEGLFAS
jgi:hypothetical protein